VREVIWHQKKTAVIFPCKEKGSHAKEQTDATITQSDGVEFSFHVLNVLDLSFSCLLYFK